jgi:hypothetical protein
MAQLNMELLNDAPVYRAEGRSTVKLPATRVTHSMVLHLAYSLLKTGGTGIGAFFADASHRLIEELILRGNDQDLLVLDGTLLNLWQLMFMREVFAQTPPTSLAAGNTEADRQSWILIPAIMGHAGSGPQNGDDQFGYPPLINPTLSVKWATPQNLVNTTHDSVLSVPVCVVELFQRFYHRPQPKGPGGYAPVFARQWSKEITATANVVFDLDEIKSARDGGPGHELRAIFIQAFGGGAAGYQYAPSDAVVTELKLDVPGEGTVQETVTWGAVQQLNKSEYGLASLQAGVAVLDAAAHDQNVSMGELWTVRGRGAPALKLACTPAAAGDSRVVVTAMYTGGRFEALARAAGR